MWSVFEYLVPANVGVSFEVIVVLVVNLGLLVFYAKDFKLGLLSGFLLNAVTFMAFYQFTLNWVVPLVLMFMNLIVMALALYAVSKVDSTRGGFV